MVGPAPATPNLNRAKGMSRAATDEGTRALWAALEELRELSKWHAQVEVETAAQRATKQVPRTHTGQRH
jgi:hypothetical protein